MRAISCSEKKQLVTNWYINFLDDAIIIANQQESLEIEVILNKISSLNLKDDNYIYTLFIQAEELIPIYIGKSTTPFKRWESHLKKLILAKGLYRNWWNLLFNEDKKSIYNIYLLFIPEKLITQPPIPGFPATVGSVEYQLISLVSDVFPKCLLNKEGNKR